MAIDYVLFSKKGNKIVCVIKLDDPSHERVERIIRDRWLNTIMTFAQILFGHASVTKLVEMLLVWASHHGEASSLPE
nr:DUF2726 domain-containing protein [Escherichia albertii]